MLGTVLEPLRSQILFTNEGNINNCETQHHDLFNFTGVTVPM